MNKRHFQILIFSFALLMVLLRPYAVYQIINRPDVISDPVKVNSLLQRLVKKKDEHRALADNDLIAVQQPKSIKIVPAIRFLLISQPLFRFTISYFKGNTLRAYSFNTNKRYLLIARLQI